MTKSDLISLTSDSSAFVHFSAAHMLAMLAIAIGAIVTFVVGCRLPQQYRRVGGWLLAALYGGVESFWILTSLDSCERMRDCLPLHLCDFSVIFAVIALATHRQFPFEFIYFFGLGGTFQAIITPDLPFTYPSESYFRFFIGHGGIIIAVAYLIATFRLRPTGASILRMIAVMCAYILLIGTFNWVAETNYGYVCEKPALGSLLDYLGPWPWYVLAASFIAIANFLLLYLPYYIYDTRRKAAALSAPCLMLMVLVLSCMSVRADVLRLADGTTYTGLLLDRTTTGIVFQRMETVRAPNVQVDFVDQTGTTGGEVLLVPPPKELHHSGPNIPINCVWFNRSSEEVSSATVRTRQYLERALRARGINVLESYDVAASVTTIQLLAKHHVLKFTRDKGDQAYGLYASNHDVTIAGTSDKGVWNGAQTLLQLITGDNTHGFEIRQCHIQDWPTIPRRICHLPRLTRNSDLELFRRYAQLLARYKFNTLILENSGAIKLEKHPEAWWSDGFSKAEIRKLIADFSELGFEVIPQLNSFGHVDEWLGKEPGDIEKYNLSELFSDSEYRDTLNPCNPRIYDILFDCYAEMLDVYGVREKPSFFHVGLDEARRRGFGKNAQCKGTPPYEIFAAHANRIGQYFAKQAVTPIMWADLLLDPAKFPNIDNCNGGDPTHFARSLDLISQTYVFMDWHYDTPDPEPTLKYLGQGTRQVWATPWKNSRNTYGHAQAAKSLNINSICATTWNFFDSGSDYMRELDIMAAPILVGNYAWNPDAPAPGMPGSFDEKVEFVRTW